MIRKKQKELLCIHSVTVREKERRKGYGSKILSLYINKIKEEQKEVKEMALLSKEYLIQFYRSVGFNLVGPSDVSHGQEQWFLLSLKL